MTDHYSHSVAKARRAHRRALEALQHQEDRLKSRETKYGVALVCRGPGYVAAKSEAAAVLAHRARDRCTNTRDS